MHELAVTQSILDISLRHAKEAGAKQITGINLVIGEFASIVDNSVQFYWDLLAEGTLAQGAQLHFERIDGEMLDEGVPDDEALRSHRLTIVDPAWEAIVPERTKYLMKVAQR